MLLLCKCITILLAMRSNSANNWLGVVISMFWHRSCFQFLKHGFHTPIQVDIVTVFSLFLKHGFHTPIQVEIVTVFSFFRERTVAVFLANISCFLWISKSVQVHSACSLAPAKAAKSALQQNVLQYYTDGNSI